MYQITDLGFNAQEEEFETAEEATRFALEVLPSDDFAYGILDVDENQYVRIVFQGTVWRPS